MSLAEQLIERVIVEGFRKAKSSDYDKLGVENAEIIHVWELNKYLTMSIVKDEDEGDIELVVDLGSGDGQYGSPGTLSKLKSLGQSTAAKLSGVTDEKAARAILKKIPSFDEYY